MSPAAKMKTNAALAVLYVIFCTFGIVTSSIDPLIPVIAEELKVGYDLVGMAFFIGLLLFWRQISLLENSVIESIRNYLLNPDLF